MAHGDGRERSTMEGASQRGMKAATQFSVDRPSTGKYVLSAASTIMHALTSAITRMIQIKLDLHLQHCMDYGCPPRSAIRRIAAVFTSFLKWNCSPQPIGVTLRYSCIPSIPYPGWSCLRSDARAFGFAPWSSNRRVNGASGTCPRWFIQKFGCDTTVAKRGV